MDFSPTSGIAAKIDFGTAECRIVSRRDADKIDG